MEITLEQSWIIEVIRWELNPRKPKPNLMCIYIYIHTSSTAQGGGGSFKNRKPIGEVGGCESGMAERSH